MVSTPGAGSLRVAFIHGRPSSHPTQQVMGQSLGADFFPVDFRLRWHDQPSASRWRRYASWLICALTFPKPSRYDLFLAMGAHTTLPLMRLLGTFPRKAKMVVHFGDEMTYSLYGGWFTGRHRQNLLSLIARYDAIVTEGTMQADLLRDMLGSKCPPIYPVINSGRTPEYNRYGHLQPRLEGYQILNISNAQTPQRIWYKGLDLMLAAFQAAHAVEPRLTLVLVGAAVNDNVQQLLDKLTPATRQAITFAGYQADYSAYVTSSAMYFHPSRGDAFPTASVLMMNTGLPALVSEFTGTRQIAKQVDGQFVAPLDADIMAQRILSYMRLPLAERQHWGQRFREVAANFTEPISLKLYQDTFDQISRDLGLNKPVNRVDVLAQEQAQAATLAQPHGHGA